MIVASSFETISSTEESSLADCSFEFSGICSSAEESAGGGPAGGADGGPLLGGPLGGADGGLGGPDGGPLGGADGGFGGPDGGLLGGADGGLGGPDGGPLGGADGGFGGQMVDRSVEQMEGLVALSGCLQAVVLMVCLALHQDDPHYVHSLRFLLRLSQLKHCLVEPIRYHPLAVFPASHLLCLECRRLYRYQSQFVQPQQGLVRICLAD